MTQKKILIVDDERELVDFIKMRLEANNYAVVVAFNGTEGLEQVQSEKPDLILLDVMMPGMDGFGVLSKLGSDPETRKIPVLMLTAKGETNSIMLAQQFRVADYIIKPFKSEDLVKAVQKCLRYA